MKKVGVLFVLIGFVLGVLGQNVISSEQITDSILASDTYLETSAVMDSSIVSVLNITCKLECFPNPIDEQSTLLFTIPTNGMVNINLLNKRGALVKVLFSSTLESGQHEYTRDFSSFAPGLYIISMHTGKERKAIPVFIY